MKDNFAIGIIGVGTISPIMAKKLTQKSYRIISSKMAVTPGKASNSETFENPIRRVRTNGG